MNKGLVSGLVLLTLGLICGLLLAGVNYLTAPIIKAEEDRIKFEAIYEFYPESSYAVEETVLTDGAIDALYIITSKTTQEVVGAVYSVKAYGYQSDIKMLIAVNNDLSMKGYKVVSQAETSGLGSNSVTHDFGIDSTITDLSGFDSMAGATVTSNAVKACFEAVKARVQTDLGGAN